MVQFGPPLPTSEYSYTVGWLVLCVWRLFCFLITVKCSYQTRRDRLIIFLGHFFKSRLFVRNWHLGHSRIRGQNFQLDLTQTHANDCSSRSFLQEIHFYSFSLVRQGAMPKFHSNNGVIAEHGLFCKSTPSLLQKCDQILYEIEGQLLI